MLCFIPAPDPEDAAYQDGEDPRGSVVMLGRALVAALIVVGAITLALLS